jgi:hypothetical protein
MKLVVRGNWQPSVAQFDNARLRRPGEMPNQMGGGFWTGKGRE